jgi:hypothetical protein
MVYIKKRKCPSVHYVREFAQQKRGYVDDDLLEVTKKAVTTIRAWYFPYAR